MHFATDPLEAQFNGEQYISRAKVSSTLGDKYKSKGAAEADRIKSAKSQTLKQRITDKMPAWKKTVNNLANPASAASRVVRATAAKGGPTKARVKSYHY